MDERLFFDPHQPVDITVRNLPHWNQNNKSYFVTFRLADAMPAEVMKEYKARVQEVEKRYPMPRTKMQQAEVDKIKHNTLEKYLDAGHGACILKESRLRESLVETLEHDEGVDYELDAYVIMPNHIHLLLATLGDKPIQVIINTIKKVSGHHICWLANCKAPLWEREYYDRLIRNAQHYNDVVAYIINNPRYCPPGSYTLCVREVRCPQRT